MGLGVKQTIGKCSYSDWTEVAGIHPDIMEKHEDLIMYKSVISEKLILFETSLEVEIPPVDLSDEVAMMRQGHVTITQNVAAIPFIENKGFMAAEQLGTDIPRRCALCKG